MAQSRNPDTGQFADVSPVGAADAAPSGLPNPGVNSAERREPLPFVTFSPGPSPCQTTGDRAALNTPPAPAGPQPTMSTTPMQDFGQVMGRTATSAPPDGVAAVSP